MTRHNFFFCYNIKLATHLINTGFVFITKAYTKDFKPFYLFENTDALSREIQIYKENKKVV